MALHDQSGLVRVAAFRSGLLDHLTIKKMVEEDPSLEIEAY